MIATWFDRLVAACLAVVLLFGFYIAAARATNCNNVQSRPRLSLRSGSRLLRPQGPRRLGPHNPGGFLAVVLRKGSRAFGPLLYQLSYALQ